MLNVFSLAAASQQAIHEIFSPMRF